jgi:hypothetical protein
MDDYGVMPTNLVIVENDVIVGQAPRCAAHYPADSFTTRLLPGSVT